MSKPYDACTKFLVEHYLPDWLALSDRRSTSASAIIDADLSTVTAAADKVLRVDDPQPWLLHLELQASRDSDLAERVQWYNALLEYRHKMPVHSLVVLLRKDADAPTLSGLFQRGFDQMLQRVLVMKESVTYQAIVAEGIRETILLLGEKRFGPPDSRSRAVLNKISDVVRLRAISERLLDVEDWTSLLKG
jgi:hypothetical protein